MMKRKVYTALTAAVLAALTLTACSKSDEQAAAAAAQQQMPKTVVDVQTIVLQPVPIIQSFSGRVAASETADVRPQVTGVIDEVLFAEGSYVTAGQALYRINTDSYVSSLQSGEAAIQNAQAAVDNAQASRASAQANLVAQEAALAQARADLARLDGLLEVEAISRQSHDQAVTAVRTAEANVAAARAAVSQTDASIKSAQSSINSAKASLNSSKLDMSRTIVRAPISGVASISQVTAGALVAANQATPLVTINRLDKVFVDISQSSAEMLRIREQLMSGKAAQGTAQVQLELESGEIYPIEGRLTMANAIVDQKTGAMTLRATFANPAGTLVPGMFVNAKLIQSVVPRAALLPQTAIMRTPKGETQVYVVTGEGKIAVRNVSTQGTYHGNWIITDGISDGDRVVVMGGAKVKPDQEVDVRELPPTGSVADASQDASAPADASADAADKAAQ